MIQPYFDFLKRVWKSYFLIHSVISKERPERKCLEVVFSILFIASILLKGHQFLIPSKKRNQNNNNVGWGESQLSSILLSWQPPVGTWVKDTTEYYCIYYRYYSSFLSDLNIQTATQLAVYNIFQQDSQTLFCFSKHIASYKPIKRPVDEPRPQHKVKNSRHRPRPETEIQAQSDAHIQSLFFSTFLIQAIQL